MLVEKLGDPVLRWEVAYRAASQAMLHGDLAEAEQLAETALEIGIATGQPDAVTFYGIQLMEVRYMQGRYGELLSLVTDAVRDNPAIPALQAAWAEVSLHAGDASSARTIVDDAGAETFAFPEDSSWLEAIAVFGRVVWELGAEDRTVTLFELLAPYRDQVPHDGLIPNPPVALHLGGLATLLRRYEEAEDYFGQAADLNVRGRMKFSDALTNLLWGQMLLQRDGPDNAYRAQTLLEQARSISAANGYARIARQSTEALSSLA